ncbi:right-handed parallel beta-helix repeat-containing protein [Mucilaginibacter terrae]|uniref:right-handed parallel beta-helix repeat-containing protein n=1 Tax=Mucilaginibacter terrae TaxID=1955052 RepID=UPI00363588A2
MKKKNLTWSLLLKGAAMAVIIAITSCQKEKQQQPAETVETTESAEKVGTLALSYGEVTGSGGTFTAKVNGVTKYTGTDYIAAIQAACNNLTAGRTSKETVLIKNSGSSGQSGGAIKAVNIPSYTILDFGNTTFACTSSDQLIVPIQGERRTDIEVKNMKVTGNPRYGIWLKTCSNIILSNITMTLNSSSGLGIRVDDSKGDWSRNFNLTSCNISGSGDNAVETYGVDGFTIGTVTASNAGACGLLLNKTKNGTVGTVNATNCGQGTGYAGFRIANNAGPNIRATTINSTGCGRGFFSVTSSNGCTITTLNAKNCQSHGALLENAQKIQINGGTISGNGAEGIRFSTTLSYICRDNIVQNLNVSGNSFGIRETAPSNYNTVKNCRLNGNGLTLVGPNSISTGNTL